MARSSWKPYFKHKDFLAQYTKYNTDKKHNIVLFNRSTIIEPYMVGLQIQVYNGIRFYLVLIKDNMVGHCLGEFAYTRKKPVIKKKKK